MTATLVNLGGHWNITVGTSTHLRRLLGGIKGRRFATDGGSLVLISEREFRAGEYAWQRPPGLMSDHYGQRASKAEELGAPARAMILPDEIRPLTHTLAARYGETWVSTHYVAVFLRLGAAEMLVPSDPTVAVIIPDFGVIMPCDPALVAEQGASS
jgi:hypothetical protein